MSELSRGDNNSSVGLDVEPSALIEKYRGLVKRIVDSVQNQVKGDVSFDDRMQYGFEGLLEAQKRFDSSANASFSTFAYYRIKGAVYDGCRKEGWGSRNQACTVEDCASINEYMAEKRASGARNKRAKSDRNFSETVSELEETVTDCVVICLLEKSDVESATSGTETAPQRQRVETKQLRSALRSAIDSLGEPDSEVIERYYFEEETLGLIARDLGYSKGWISRVNKRAITELKEYLAEQYELEKGVV